MEEKKEEKKQEVKKDTKEIKKEIKEEDKKIKELETKATELMKEVDELQDKCLRSQAEMINYRTRKDEEVSQMLNYANEDIVKDILPVIDSFDRAIAMDAKDPNVTKYLEGFKLIYNNLNKVLVNYGVKEINKKDVPFDPSYHQAVITEQKMGQKPDMVIEVLQKGYMLKDKVLRPAMVKVSK